MTLTITAGAGIAGRFLAPHAGRAAGKIAKKATYRYRVARTATKAVEFQVKAQLVREWLRTIEPEDLESPFELSGPDLALRLDEFLSRHDGAWITSTSHLSRALELVEAIFLAVLKCEDLSRYRQLIEHWARVRNDRVVEALADAAGGYAGGMSAEDRALWLGRRSTARRRDRLAPFGIEPEQVSGSLALVGRRLPDVPPGAVRLVIGGYGSGKSEMVEEWHRRAVQRYASSVGAPLPVWLHARAAVAGGLERALHSQIGSTLREAGVFLALDGLDEVDAADAEALLRDARVVVAGDERSSVLITSRPGVVSVPQEDEIEISPLDDSDVRILIESVCGGEQMTWAWSAELQSSIRSPFFALAAGARIRDGANRFEGESDLIIGLVQTALSRGSAQVATQNEDVFGLLVRCAAALVDSGARSDGLTFVERQRLRATRLVSEAQGGNVAFTLPIFEQWFAAQGLLQSPPQVRTALRSPGAFGRWRWSLAIAVQSAPTRLVDDLLESIFATNPGAGAWVTNASARKQNWHNPPPMEDIGQQEAQERLLGSLKVWSTSLGPLSPSVLPHSAVGEPFNIGARAVGGRRIHVGRRFDPTGEDACVELPERVHPLMPVDAMVPGWWPMYAGVVDPGPTWPWTFWRDVVAKRTTKLLEGDEQLGPAGGIWERERVWSAARMLVRQSDLMHRPLLLSDLNEAVQEQLAVAREVGAEPMETTFQFDRLRSLPGTDLLALERHIATSNETHLHRPVPVPDLERPTSGLVTGLYSESRLVEFAAEMLGLACECYEQLAASQFSAFAWSLGTGATGAFGVIGRVELDSSHADRLLGRPIMRYILVPMTEFERHIDAYADLTLSSNGRAAFSATAYDDAAWTEIEDSWLERARSERGARQSNEGPFASLSITGTGIEVGHPRPVSNCVAGWLFRDLQRFSLATGTFPTLRH